jgi:hypothetical protein
MDYDKVDLKAASEDVKYFICHLAATGWENVEGGFRVRATDRTREVGARLFPEATTEGDHLTVTGETAESFMSLYRRAASGPPTIVPQFTAWFETWVEVEATLRSKLMKISMVKARRDVREEALVALKVELDRRWEQR